MDISQFFKQYPKVFITGTDTEVGKTYCASLLVSELVKQGIDVFPFKPISAGTQLIEQSQYSDQHIEVEPSVKKPVNEDALALYRAANKVYSIEQINPIVFEPPIAPHIAAEMAQQSLNLERLNTEYKKITKLGQVQIIEGAGGWLLPLNDHQLLSDWVSAQQFPVIMVVGIKLGCLNHAMLTTQAIAQSGCKLVGWVANFITGENDINMKNLAYLEKNINAPLITCVSQNQTSLSANIMSQ